MSKRTSVTKIYIMNYDCTLLKLFSFFEFHFPRFVWSTKFCWNSKNFANFKKQKSNLKKIGPPSLSKFWHGLCPVQNTGDRRMVGRAVKLNIHFVESVRIRSFSGPYFPAFELKTDQKNSKYGHFSRSDPFRFG